MNRWCGLFSGILLLGALVFSGPKENLFAQSPGPEPITLGELRRFVAKAPPSLQSLFREIVSPTDELTMAGGKTIQVRPLADPLPDKKDARKFLTCQDRDGKSLRLQEIDITQVRYFEQQVLTNIGQFRQSSSEPETQGLLAGEYFLRASLLCHSDLRRHSPLGVNPWEHLRRALLDQLQEIRARYLRLLPEKTTQQKEWAQALAQAAAWHSLYPVPGPVRDAFRDLKIRYALFLIEAKDWSAVREQLTLLQGEFPNLPQAEPLRQVLRGHAEVLVKQAANLPPAQALSFLQQALKIWPSLPGLADRVHQLQGTYKILYVAVPSLPVFFSPATAWTDPEKQVLDLIFEPLIRSRPTDQDGLRYEPVLAEKLPQSHALHRSFTLVPETRWSDGEPVTAGDVRHTLQLLTSVDLAGRNSIYRDLLEPLHWSGDPRTIDFHLTKGLFDSLEPLSFPVVPQQFQGKPLTRADDAEFAQRPIGSGPFFFQGQVREDGRTYVVFHANPYFQARGGHGSSIREIRFFSSPSEKKWAKPLPHLVLNRPGNDLSQAEFHRLSLPTPRRIYFLAANQREPRIASVNLRRFLALGLDRDKILDKHFVDPKKNQESSSSGSGHHPVSLNGPYPLDSWATCPAPRVPHKLFQPDLARSLARELKKELGKVNLSLKFPNDDPCLEGALQDMAKEWCQLAGEVGLELQLQLLPLPPHDLRSALYRRDFELLYHHHDFANAAYSLGPLFDTHPDALRPGGSNFLGYENDAKLQNLLSSALSHRSFSSLQEITHNIHVHLYERMPFIPLWQLPYQLNVHSSLRLDHVDPLRIFADVRQWEMVP